MKFIIIGLGNFGSSLAKKLTQMGHEVIGVDNQLEKVEGIKDQVTHSICLDCRNQESVKHLPLKDTDVVVICIGEDEGANLLATALMKKMEVPRLVSRSVSQIHETILQAMDVVEIVRPEMETAERWAKRLTSGIIDSFELTDNYSIIEVKVPKKFDGKTIKEVGFNEIYNVIVLTTMTNIDDKKLFGKSKKTTKHQLQGIATANTVLSEGDIMVLYGHNDNIHKVFQD